MQLLISENYLFAYWCVRTFDSMSYDYIIVFL